MDWKNVFLVVAAVVIGAVVLLYAFPSGEGTEETVTTNLTINFYGAPEVSINKGSITTWTMVDGEWEFTTEPGQGSNTTWIFQNITAKPSCYDQLLEAMRIAGSTLVSETQTFGTFVTSIDGVNNMGFEKRGWQYYVNDVYSNRACDKYVLDNEDNVAWEYIKNPFTS